MFKVGDRVHYHGRGRGFTGYMIGRVGRVLSTSDGGWAEVLWEATPDSEELARGAYFRNIELYVEPDKKPRGPLPEDSAERKEYPLYRGLFAYFPSALAAIAKHSKEGNDKHNPGQDMHHARGKSSDHRDALLRHVLEDDLVGAAWRALALLQEDMEAKGAPVAPGARFPDGAE